VFDLVTAGEAFDDLVFFDLTALPAAGRELKTDAFVRTVGGGAVISAVAAARVGGLRVRVAAGLSVDAIRVLGRERIAATNLRRPGEPNALTVALSTRRDRRFVTFVGMNAQLPARVRRAVTAIRARHYHFALHPGRCRPWLRLLRRIRRRGATVSWDFGWNPDLARDPAFGELADALDYLFLNRAEARVYRCRARTGLTVTKMGAAGCRAIGNGVDLRIAAPRVRVVDTTGAGDVFNGVFLAARLQGASAAAALRAATRAAAQSTRHAGGIP
jgi:ribokinase